MTIPTDHAVIRDLGELRSLEFGSLRAEGILHAIYTRHGGQSSPPYHSFNLSTAVGDDPAAVRANRELALSRFPARSRQLVQTRQIHSATVVTAHAAAQAAQAPHADGLITNSSSYLLTMRYADCVPILLFDRVQRAIGLGHAGWRGTASGIASELLAAMGHAYGSRPEDIVAAMGPAICAQHYPVGPDVRREVEARQGAWAVVDFHEIDGQLHFDLVRANRRQLERAGVIQIEDSATCTACRVDDWYSHRAESGRTGRFGVYLALPFSE